MITGGGFAGVSYEVYHWGVLIYGIDDSDQLIQHKYVGNGTDPLLITELVQDFKERYSFA